MKNQIKLEVATQDDAEQIRDMMILIEADETSRWYSNGERPYIPGFDSVSMHEYHAREENYYKILMNEISIGVILISTTGREHGRIDRLYIDPKHQGKQIGSKVLQLIEEKYPKVKIWTLDTIQKSTRNHHFYEKNGYKVVAENDYERYYCKEIDDPNCDVNRLTRNKDFSKHNFRDCNLQEADFYNINLEKSCFSDANMSGIKLQNINLSRTYITNTNLSNSILGDSNMSNVEICHVSLAGAYIHDVNLNTGNDKLPLVLERCEMINSTITDSNLQNLSIKNCNLDGMSIDGILVTDLLEVYSMKR
ncbi:GNAT family N-acetyltransferase [Paenibacillus sp. IHBB 10380]|uniref:GNAT family N-acetyltransferase n=1 Tax=Paenibacillus sp. IHBB 10380 TaxID=1566358 RepID=UPI0005CFAA3E|nr:GNAT family N-acetyltransferase [Paenibacillus sp. IHBB 10380]AJS59297.1 acetyltransferase [Paenibacillus sp. IHBB 10380]